MRSLLALLLLAAVGAACDRPTESACRQAVSNLQKLNDPEGTGLGPDPESFIRKCRATGKRSTVACLSHAHTVEDAQACAGPPPKK